MDASRARIALERVLGSVEFGQAKRSAEILRYVVEQCLAGKQDEIKERLIGADVFGRKPDYDVKVDSIVRVEARRLRGKLTEYYAGSGAGEVDQLRLEAGSYVPELIRVEGAKPARAARSWRVPAAVAGLLLLSGVVGGWLWTRGRPKRESIQTSIVVPVDQELTGGVAITAAGDEIAYTAARQGTVMAFRRSLARYEPEVVPGSDGTVAVAYSPDGRMLALCAQGKLGVYALGGELRWLAGSQCIHEAVWSHRNTLYSRSDKGVLEIGLNGGVARTVLTNRMAAKGFEYIGPVREAADGRLLVGVNFGPQDRHLEWVVPETGARTVYQEQAMGGPILASGEVLTYWNGMLRVGKQTAPVSVGVAAASWFEGSADAALNGTLVYLSRKEPAERRLVWAEMGGKVTAAPVPATNWLPLGISPDGKQALVSREDSVEEWSVWLYPIAGGEWRKLITGHLPRASAVWEPDGKSVIVASDLAGERFVNLYRIRLDNITKPERLTQQPHFGQYPQAVAGGWLLYQEGVRPGAGSDLYEVRVEEPRGAPRLFVGGPDWDSEAAIQPGGKSVAYRVTREGKSAVHVRAFPEPGGAEVYPKGLPGQGPVWSPDGKRLYFYREGEGILGMDFPGGEPKLAVPGSFVWAPDGWGRTAALHPDGKRWLLAQLTGKKAANQELKVVFGAVPGRGD